MTKLALVVLDLDGTLYSSRATTLGAVEHAVADLNSRHGLGMQTPGDGQILAGVGCTRVEFAKRVFPALPADYHDEIDGLVWRWERELITAGLGSLFPGAREALDELRRGGFRLAVATNAGRPYMDTVLDHFDVRECFEECRCAGDGAAGDKGDLVRAIVASLGVEAVVHRDGRRPAVGHRGGEEGRHAVRRLHVGVRDAGRACPGRTRSFTASVSCPTSFAPGRGPRVTRAAGDLGGRTE